ncbi:HAUS augmin-like complex subunit 1 [Dysidea avara]|uniref:HAUS augmin-like complex subunit 1 n=1 Tax=Dysidea avara TaxID=196820 RepID=UPI00331930BF
MAELTPSLEEKYAFVQQWLSSVFDGEQKISDYTINSQTIDLLYEAAVEAEEDRRRVQLVAEGYRQRAEEYKAETKRLQGLHKHIGINQSDMSEEARKAIEDTVTMAVNLDLKDCSYTSFLLAVSDRKRKQAQQAERELKDKRKTERQLERSEKAGTTANHYHQMLETFQQQKQQQEQVKEEKLQYVEFLKQKSEQYQSQINKMKEELSRNGYQSSLSHSSLLSVSQEISELRKQLNPLKEKISSFQNLPPDMSLARVKLEEARRELALLEDKLTNNVDLTEAEK